MGAVSLRVADLDRSLRFYHEILGYVVELVGDDAALLRPALNEPHHFELRAVPGAGRAPRQAVGLYHAAILLPTRHDLAQLVVQLHEQGVPFGHSDHGVSEALYLDDPDGNGLEIYADRPRDQWQRDGEGVAMVVDPLDFENLLGKLHGKNDRWSGMPSHSTIGHVHLRVSDLAEAIQFYVDLIGFDVMQSSLPGALFVAAGGYHHHLGLNVWESRGRPRGPEDAAGLDAFAVELPDAEAFEALLERVKAAGMNVQRDGDALQLRDADGICLHVKVAG